MYCTWLSKDPGRFTLEKRAVALRGDRWAPVTVGNVRFAAHSQTGVARSCKIFLGRYFYFGMALAIYFRKRPEYHRRLVFLASCQLMQAIFVRFHYLGYHDLYFPALDLLVVAGILRDLVVDGRVNRVYLYVFPAMVVLQALAMYLKRMNPSWWHAATLAILRS